MARIGLIGGTTLKDWDEFEIKEKIEKNTPWGTPSSPLFKGSLNGEEIMLLMRHGQDHTIPPHRINHRANIYALQKEVDEIIGICSSGALKEDIEVPSLSIPDDYVSFWNPITFYNEKIKHVTPELSQVLRNQLIEAAKEVDNNNINSGGIYVQTEGPRLETKAEVRVLQKFGDLVGMTMASEATLSKESALNYAALVTVDNYAHGVKDEKVEYEEIVDTAIDNWDNVKDVLTRFLKRR